MNHFSIGLWDAKKSGFIQQPVMTSSVTGPRSSKPLSKAKLAPKKGHGHWWSAACLIHYSFLNPAKTITSEKYGPQIDEMHQKLQCLQLSLIKNWPNSSAWQYLTSGRTINTSKVKWIGLWSFASSAIFTWPLANWLLLSSSISTTFCRENASTTSRRQKKRFPRVCWILKHEFLCYKNKLTSHWQKCVDCNGSYFD